MRTTETTQKNRAAGINKVAPWRVQSVKPLPDFQMEVAFVDGLQGIVDMKNFLKKECGVFKSLRDISLFNEVRVEHGAVSWPGDLDLAPDTMHEEIAKSGAYIMQ